jgi:hypothetical protein
MQLIGPLLLLSFSALVFAQASDSEEASESAAEEIVGETTSSVHLSSEKDEPTTTSTKMLSLTTTADDDHESESSKSTDEELKPSANASHPGVLDQSENVAGGQLNLAAGAIGGLALAVGVLLL